MGKLDILKTHHPCTSQHESTNFICANKNDHLNERQQVVCVLKEKMRKFSSFKELQVYILNVKQVQEEIL